MLIPCTYRLFIMYYVRTHDREQRKQGIQEVCEDRELLYLIFQRNTEEQAQYIQESEVFEVFTCFTAINVPVPTS